MDEAYLVEVFSAHKEQVYGKLIELLPQRLAKLSYQDIEVKVKTR